MDFTDSQTTTPGQMLAGQQPSDPQQVGNLPLAQRMQQFQGPQQQPQPQQPQAQQPPPAPTPQQADAIKHHALGKAAAFLFGQQADPNTGEPVKQQPGTLFRSLLAGALLGGAMGGSDGSAGGGKFGGFLSGFARGGNAVQHRFERRRWRSEDDMIVDWSEVSAIATVIYGAATLALVVQIWRDRVQRDRHFSADAAQRKLNELRSAFYDAVGYWTGHTNRSGGSPVDAAQAGRVFEALTRLECQLRLNGYKDEARDLGFGVRKLAGVTERLEQIGSKLGLFDIEYHPVGPIYLKDVR